MKEKVVIGLSGGVDSSVAAYLLKEQGYEVLGVTMKLHGDVDPDAKRVADALGIPFTVLDFTDDFNRYVVDNFAEEYAAGHTPNPCIQCNRHVKFGALLKYADSVGAKYIATGHYAQVVRLPNGRFTVKRAAFDKKDQTYALYRLTQEQLSRTLMPVGIYDKEEIRTIAEKIGLDIAHKHDSQEICFIPDDDHGRFLTEYLGPRMPKPGSFVTADGKVLGTHKGIVYYTIGQRKGLDIALGHPVYVTDIRPERDEVVIGENEDLFTCEVTGKDVVMMGTASIDGEIRAAAKIRYGHKGAPCTVSMIAPDESSAGSGPRVRVVFDEPQRAVTKGQSVVVYDGDHILCGGIIC